MRPSLLVAALLLATSLVASPAGAASIGFSSANYAPGSTFEVPILVTEADDLFAFNFDIAFDPLVVELLGVSRGAIFSGLGTPCDECFFPGFSDTPGTVSFIADSLSGAVEGVDGLGTLALLTFQASALGGNVGLAIEFVEFFAPPAPGEIFPSPIPLVEIQNGVVSVDVPSQPIPEPSTLALLGVGLAALARQRLRRKPHPDA
jgi:general secretion pathway protein D